jgi:hypothetical protein
LVQKSSVLLRCARACVCVDAALAAGLLAKASVPACACRRWPAPGPVSRKPGKTQHSRVRVDPSYLYLGELSFQKNEMTHPNRDTPATPAGMPSNSGSMRRPNVARTGSRIEGIPKTMRKSIMLQASPTCRPKSSHRVRIGRVTLGFTAIFSPLFRYLGRFSLPDVSVSDGSFRAAHRTHSVALARTPSGRYGMPVRLGLPSKT